MNKKFFCFLLMLILRTGYADVSTDVSIYNIGHGALITVWAKALNSWLWGYSAHDIGSFGKLSTWTVKYNPDSTLSFKNKAIGSCMVAYNSSGLTHGTCKDNEDNQKFYAIPTTTGALLLKSKSQNKCIVAENSSSSAYARSLSFTDCPKAGENVYMTILWSIIAKYDVSTVLSS